MNRSSRLLSLLQILRRHRFPVTAAALSQELEVSMRTLYRDIAALQASGAPVRGEAGVGYVLEAGYDLPPLMFTADELEALMLGAHFVRENGDPALGRAALDAVAKIAAVLPNVIAPMLSEASLFAPRRGCAPVAVERFDLAALRKAIRAGVKVALDYRDAQGAASRRVVWPIALGYFERARVVVAWCELRQDFRSFRTDRVETFEVSAERYPERRARLVARWRAVNSQRGEPACLA